jgi:hypothetical protein
LPFLPGWNGPVDIANLMAAAGSKLVAVFLYPGRFHSPECL